MADASPFVVSPVHVQRPRDFAEWRTAARSFLAAEIAPQDIHWLAEETGAAASLFADQATPLPTAPTARRIAVPPKLLATLQRAACYRDSARWALLYKVLWRWTHGDQASTSPADTDGARLHVMTKAVSREIHHMHAYVRFRERVETGGALLDGPQFVAWFEPAHNVLREAVQHFVDRMGKASWLIATPDATAAWDGTRLQLGPGVSKPEEIEDSGEALWLRYYRNTFNPSRVNTDVMRSHMPVRFWKNLPEAPLIPVMVAAAETGARRIGQSQDVDAKVRAGEGAIVNIAADKAQPHRPTAHALDECRRCELWRDATHGVPGAGPGDARIIIVGEQPGDQEDLAGKPFVGPAGHILDKALIEAGIARDEVYVTNAVKHFKWELRGKRRLHKTPAQKEIEACHYWLQGELNDSRAKVIVTLGATALKSILETKTVALGNVMGKVLEHEDRKIVPTYHPSYVLRLREHEEKAQAERVIVDALKRAHQLARA